MKMVILGVFYLEMALWPRGRPASAYTHTCFYVSQEKHSVLFLRFGYKIGVSKGSFRILSLSEIWEQWGSGLWRAPLVHILVG